MQIITQLIVQQITTIMVVVVCADGLPVQSVLRVLISEKHRGIEEDQLPAPAGVALLTARNTPHFSWLFTLFSGVRCKPPTDMMSAYRAGMTAARMMAGSLVEA